MAFRHPALRLGFATLLFVSAGCAAKRELRIDSDPAGALVRLDDEVVGLTPYAEDFLAYGTRRVTVYRDGYRTSSRRFTLRPPWYARFPLDFLSEVLLPFGWEDVQVVHITLEPESGGVTEAALEKVLERANSLRLAGPEGPRPLPPGTSAPDSEPAKPASKPDEDERP